MWLPLMLILNPNGVVSMSPEMIDLLTPVKHLGEACGYDSCPTSRPGVLNVHVVPNTHYELGYGRTFYEHYTGTDRIYATSTVNMKRTLDFVITELWAQKRRRFTLSDFPYFFHWWSKRDHAVRRMVFELLRQGRLFFVGGGWSMNDEATVSYHAIIDSFTYNLRKINATFLECGRPLVAWQSDVMGHSREMASLLAQMGYSGVFINPISFDDELARMRRLALEMIWRGSDDLASDVYASNDVDARTTKYLFWKEELLLTVRGPPSDIFTHKLFDGYWSPPGFCFSAFCGDPLLISSDSLFANMAERGQVFIDSMMERQSPNYNTSHVMVMMGQLLGFHDAKLWFANIDKLIDTVNSLAAQRGKSIYMTYSTPACYLRAVHEENPPLETKQDDFFPVAYDKTSYFTGLFTSHPPMKLMAREGLVYLQIAKQMQVLARLPDNSQTFEELNWIVAAFQDHLILPGIMRDYVKDYYVHKMYVAVQKTTLLLKQAWNKLRKSPSGIIYYRCTFNISSCHTSRAKYSFIVIYNPLAWSVTMPIRMPILLSGEMKVYLPDGEQVKSAVVKIPDAILDIKYRTTTANYELVFIAENIPPLGFRSYFIEKYTGARKRRTLIKNLKRKANKKYLIRQANSNDTTLLGDEYVTDDLDNDEDDTKTLTIDVEDKKTKTMNDSKKANAENSSASHITILDDTKKILWNEYEKRIKKKTTTGKPKVDVAVDYDKISLADDAGDDEVVTVKDLFDEVVSDGSVSADRSTIDSSKDTKLEQEILHRDIDTTTADTEPTRTTLTYTYNPLDGDGRRMYGDGEVTGDKYIENKYIRIKLDPTCQKVSGVTLANGLHINLDIQFYYYIPDDPVGMKKTGVKRPGPYIFRSLDNKPVPILDYLKVNVYKTKLVEEVQYRYADWASLVVRLYVDSPIVEVDWLVGPVPFYNNLGKEIFIRYTTDLLNDGVFYTDSNGRQTIKRIRNLKPMYESLNNDAVAGNFYPVTTKIYIEDLKRNMRFSVFPDRAQGGASLYDGEVDLMIQRRLLTDDTGIDAYMNDTEFGEDVLVRGKHYLYLSKADFKPNRIFEKKLAKEIELMPQVLVSPPDPLGNESKVVWLENVNEMTFLNKKLPVGIHILTLETWNSGTILLRLENFLEKSDVKGNGVKKVKIEDIFVNLRIKYCKETTLAANVWLEKLERKKFSKKEDFVKNFNEFYGASKTVEFLKDEVVDDYVPLDLKFGLSLSPQQIRTLVCTFNYI